MIQKYEPSGRFEPKIFALAIPAVALGAVFGVIYQFIIDWIPLIYINFFVALGFGLALAVMSGMFFKVGKCRNPMIAAVLAILISVAGVISSHVVAFYNVNNQLREELSNSAELPADQKAALSDMRLSLGSYLKIREEAGWEISFKGKINTINGKMVYLFWLIEALLIMGVGISVAVGYSLSPYCERCDCWADEKKTVWQQDVSDPEKLMRIITAVDFNQLLDLQSGSSDFDVLLDKLRSRPVLLEYVVESCPICRSTAFLTITQVVTELDKHGKETRKATNIHEHLLLSPDERQRLEAVAVGAKPQTGEEKPEAPSAKESFPNPPGTSF